MQILVLFNSVKRKADYLVLGSLFRGAACKQLICCLIQVDPANVRSLEEEAADALRQAEKEAEATKMAIKRKIEQAATSDFQMRSLPTKLRIDPNDPEDVVS